MKFLNISDINLPTVTFGRDELKEINYGATRVVFELQNGSKYDGKVIKFARTKKDIQTNEKEIETWKTEKSRNPEYFCKIHEYDRSGKWIIMDKSHTNVNSRQAHNFREKIRDEYEGIVPEGNLDLISANMGINATTGNIELIDYSWGRIR